MPAAGMKKAVHRDDFFVSNTSDRRSIPIPGDEQVLQPDRAAAGEGLQNMVAPMPITAAAMATVAHQPRMRILAPTT